ncbi:MAG TPA: acetyl-CoA carboxylase carboxyltransferase subunit alpha [Thermomicrobiales bacterium]|jgi:acetyl-CoA carboxylase carboxyl transferase subunit alpha|nr:acetyl-CoA carboxylase carboxyltransferase subunit alpha [Thermomicrobiales bacterium]
MTSSPTSATNGTSANAAGGHSAISAWERVKLARLPERPRALDYIDGIIGDFVELHGDRTFGDDRALIGGIGRLGARTVLVLAQQRGFDTKENIARNFGMSRPEGYRKARRLLDHAGTFGIPVVSLIDTPAADPGLGSEERGQATAIAESLLAMASAPVPIVACVIGQGGSGGALAIGVADRILMLENAIYAVAPPEACASILWKDSSKAPEAAETMRITAPELHRFGIIDTVVAEPTPAHEAPDQSIRSVGRAIEAALDELDDQYPPGDADTGERLLADRYAKFRRIGAWRESSQREWQLPTD